MTNTHYGPEGEEFIEWFKEKYAFINKTEDERWFNQVVLQGTLHDWKEGSGERPLSETIRKGRETLGRREVYQTIRAFSVADFVQTKRKLEEQGLTPEEARKRARVLTTHWNKGDSPPYGNIFRLAGTNPEYLIEVLKEIRRHGLKILPRILSEKRTEDLEGKEFDEFMAKKYPPSPLSLYIGEKKGPKNQEEHLKRVKKDLESLTA